MYHSSNALQGSPSFTIKTLQDEEGHWRAQAPNIEGMEEVTAPTEVEAVREMQIKLQHWMVAGAPRLTR